MPRTPSQNSSWVLAFVLVTAFVSVAEAQSSALEIARTGIMREAEAAAQRSEHATAIERAERALALRATPSVQRFLAREHEALEHFVESLALATACERSAEADASLHNREALLRSCRGITARVSVRVGRITVEVEAPVPHGLIVRIGGEVLPEALLRVPYVVAPGVVRVDAEAPGYAPLHREETIASGHTEELRIALVRIEPPTISPEPVPVPGPRVEPQVPALRVQIPPPSLVPEPSRAPWSSVGVGLSVLTTAGFVGSGLSFWLAEQAHFTRDMLCASPCYTNNEGYPAAAEQDQLYRNRLGITTGMLVTGSVFAVGTVLWWILARPSAVRRPVAPVVASTSFGQVALVW